MEPLLPASNVNVRFQMPGAKVVSVKNVSVEIAKGETVALVGESPAPASRCRRCPCFSFCPTRLASPSIRQFHHV